MQKDRNNFCEGMNEPPTEKSQDIVKVHLNLEAIRGRFLTQLQRLTDILAVSLIGLENVDEQSYSSYSPFWRVEPAKNRRSTVNTATSEAEQWYLCGVVRDAIELTNDFVQDCWIACSIMSLSVKKARGQDLNELFGQQTKKFHSLGLPNKIKKLRKDFGVFSELESHVLGINTARACLVHRSGFVSTLDADTNGQLIIRWRTIRLSARSPDEKSEVLLDHKDILVKAGWKVSGITVDEEKAFKLGDRIELSYKEMSNILFTLMIFASTLVDSVRSYAKRNGVSMLEPEQS